MALRHCVKKNKFKHACMIPYWWIKRLLIYNQRRLHIFITKILSNELICLENFNFIDLIFSRSNMSSSSSRPKRQMGPSSLRRVRNLQSWYPNPSSFSPFVRSRTIFFKWKRNEKTLRRLWDYNLCAAKVNWFFVLCYGWF